MTIRIGIRREDKNPWEARAPLTPEHVAQLIHEYGWEFWVQPSDIRIFEDEEYAQAGAKIEEDLSPCPVVLAIKEIPEEFFHPGSTYVFFSHVIKGQAFNMAMLQKMMDLGCQLIDYEKIEDENGRRLVFFGNYAGLAGMLDTLWGLGERLHWEGIDTPFYEIQQARRYAHLAEAEEAVGQIGQQIAQEGLPEPLAPLVVGFAGYGNVSTGAQQILNLLPVIDIEPEELSGLAEGDDYSRHHVYKVVFKEEHMVEPVSPETPFELQDYYDHPEKYRSVFHTYLPYLSVLVNGIYWDKMYPRLVTQAFLQDWFEREPHPRLKIIGDISCDLRGAIECTVQATDSGDPLFTYNPLDRSVRLGVEGPGLVVLAVDNLPCELPRDATRFFSQVLLPFVEPIVTVDYTVPFEACDLPREIKEAVIVYQGNLTPDYVYLEKFLSQQGGER